MPIEISENVLQNDEFSMVTDSNGDLVLEHKPTGGQFKFDSANNAWTPVQGLAMGGANISGAGSFNSSSADVSGPVVSNSVEAQDINSDTITNSGLMETTDLDVSGDADGVAQGLQGCRVRLTTDFNLTSTRQKIPFDAEVFDSQSNFDTATSEWTCPKTGIYMAKLLVDFKSTSNGSKIVAIGNGTASGPSGEGEFSNLTTGSARINTSTINFYDAGDTIAFYASDGGGGVAGSGSANFNSHAEVVFLGEV
jgi:hypothetical protein